MYILVGVFDNRISKLLFVSFLSTTIMSQKKEECIPGDCTNIKVTGYAIFLQYD